MLDEFRVATITTSDIVKELLTEEDKASMAGGGLFPREDELRAALQDRVEAVFALGAQVILLDGFPRFDDQVRWMVQNFYQYPLQVVQVLAPSDFELVRRASLRNRDEYDQQDKLLKRVAKQRELIAGVEKMIFQYNLPYTSVYNTSLDEAVSEACAKIKWPQYEKTKKKGH